MTKFEELQEIITRKKNKDKISQNSESEVAGSEKSKAPLASVGVE